MLSNQSLTLKSSIPISYGADDTFKIFEKGIDVIEASVVFSITGLSEDKAEIF